MLKFREVAAPAAVVFPLCGVAFLVYGLTGAVAGFPGWIAMGLSLSALVYIFETPFLSSRDGADTGGSAEAGDALREY